MAAVPPADRLNRAALRWLRISQLRTSRSPGKNSTSAESIAATSANLPGGVDPRRIADVPPELVAAAGAVVDGGELPGTPSTVVDVTGAEPVILREGAVPSVETLERAAAALTDR